MATTEYEQVTDYETGDSPGDTDDDCVVHLYAGDNLGAAACGFRKENDRHIGKHEGPISWQKGMMSCPVCAAPICMNCLLEAS